MQWKLPKQPYSQRSEVHHLWSVVFHVFHDFINNCRVCGKNIEGYRSLDCICLLFPIFSIICNCVVIFFVQPLKLLCA
ncbi:hypothetical protein CARUB_v10007875mg [Capsella rubella]|uniref:Uncharacterized protein n=1 Tax=Capsella rubella TaxID=81985 RepID=R0FAY2_9BRAS|nr:hypothetical protein CARUB_v10007875mg [Capsella rubella]